MLNQSQQKVLDLINTEELVELTLQLAAAPTRTGEERKTRDDRT